MDIAPPTKLEPQSQPWGRWATENIRNNTKNAARLKDDVSRENSSTSANLGKLQEQVKTLQDLAVIEYSEFTTPLTGSSGWYPSPAATFIYSSTGRVEIGFGGSLNGGTGYFCYSIYDADPIVSRETILENPAQRVAVSGGAGFAPSGFKTAIVYVPKGRSLTIRLEVYGSDSFTYFFGGSIYARLAPDSVLGPSV